MIVRQAFLLALSVLATLAAGAGAVGVGGWLTGQNDLAEIARRARSLADSVAHLR